MRPLFLLVLLIVWMAVTGAVFAPYVYPEWEHQLHGKETAILPRPTVPVAGRWVDDYFVVEPIDERTIAIGEPRYYQGNYSYLLLGDQRAVLFDAGTGTRDIVPVVRALTTLPVTVIASHLHFDHVGALGHFDRTAVLDVPALRARVRDSMLTLGRYEFMGFTQDLVPPTFRVDEWWAAGTTIDLGGRTVRVLPTPGHTPTSVSLYDGQHHQLFVGDYLYPGHLYAFLPGSSRSAYLATTRQLLSTLDPTTRIYCAHMQDPPAPVRAPVLEVADLQALERTLNAMQEGTISGIDPGGLGSTAGFPRVFPVRGIVTFATGYRWNNP
jgi:hydroxyacylglutathione hydrolase